MQKDKALENPPKESESGMDLLKLVALDDDDLNIISAHVQDAVMKTGEFSFERRQKRFVIPMKRFAWEKEKKGFFRRMLPERRLSVLHFDRVEAVRSAGIDTQKPDDVLSLLAVRFIAGEAPSGTVEIIFSGEATIQLDVECIEARLNDLGAAWQASAKPRHEV